MKKVVELRDRRDGHARYAADLSDLFKVLLLRDIGLARIVTLVGVLRLGLEPRVHTAELHLRLCGDGQRNEHAGNRCMDARQKNADP